MGFYAKDEPAQPDAARTVTGALSRARKPRPGNAIPPILTVGIGHRFYNPGLGRWLSRDPLMERGADNLNSWCSNNGVEIFDPIGLADFTFLIADLGPRLSAQHSTEIKTSSKKHLFRKMVKDAVVAAYNPPPTYQSPCEVRVQWTARAPDLAPALERSDRVYLIGHGTPGTHIADPGSSGYEPLRRRVDTAVFSFDDGPRANVAATITGYDQHRRDQWLDERRKLERIQKRKMNGPGGWADPYGRLPPEEPSPLLGKANCTVYVCHVDDLDFKADPSSPIVVQPFKQTKDDVYYISALADAAQDLLKRLGASCCAKQITWDGVP